MAIELDVVVDAAYRVVDDNRIQGLLAKLWVAYRVQARRKLEKNGEN